MVARMMDAMGNVLDMSLGKNQHCIVPPPNIQGRFEGDTDQNWEEQIEFHAAGSVMRDLGLIDE
jgi:hypothetical protein